jgi:hypothetical protein
LESPINKLPDYLRIQWAFYVNERDIQFPNLESFLGWIYIQININSVVELDDSESHRRERERYPEDINREKRERDQNYGDLGRKFKVYFI